MKATRLATYGTLAPGRVNHHQLSELDGSWSKGTVKGKLLSEGWGSDLGYPGIVLDPDGDPVDVFVFQSADLPDHWERLDAFEGDGYRRVPVTVQTNEGDVEAQMYVLNRG
ncbi:MAG: gamma-glutamylcyclotransferase family protein [Pseudomonadota bacterium]